MGAVMPEALAAWEELLEDDCRALACSRSPRRTCSHRGWTRAQAARWSGRAQYPSHIEQLLSPLSPKCRPGDPRSTPRRLRLSWLGGVRRPARRAARRRAVRPDRQSRRSLPPPTGSTVLRSPKRPRRFCSRTDEWSTHWKGVDRQITLTGAQVRPFSQKQPFARRDLLIQGDACADLGGRTPSDDVRPQADPPRRTVPSRRARTDRRPASRKAWEELEYVRRMLDIMGDAGLRCCCDLHGIASLCNRSTSSAQMLGHIAQVIRSSDPEGAVETIGMSELKARLQRRSIG